VPVHILQRGVFDADGRISGVKLLPGNLDPAGYGVDLGLRFGHLFLALLNLCVEIGRDAPCWTVPASLCLECKYDLYPFPQAKRYGCERTAPSVRPVR